jgi:hypothetical protein
LGTEFPVRLEANHVVDLAKQVRVCAVASCGGKLLDARYKQQASPEYATALGNSIIAVARNIRGGILVFFPSYRLLEAMMVTWKRDGIVAAVERATGSCIFVEPRDTKDLNSVLLQFYSVVDKDVVVDASRAKHASCTAVLLAVCRGKVSEGINFSDHFARAVIVVGIPYPSLVETFVTLKRDYQDEKHRLHKDLHLSGDAWYNQEAFRAINQSIGRCIRHMDDFGVILLFDPRYHNSNVKANLSKWLRKSVTNFYCVTDTLAPMSNFFETILRRSLTRSAIEQGNATSATITTSTGNSFDEDSEYMTASDLNHDTTMDDSQLDVNEGLFTPPIRRLKPASRTSFDGPESRAKFCDFMSSICTGRSIGQHEVPTLSPMPSLVAFLNEGIIKLLHFYAQVSKELRTPSLPPSYFVTAESRYVCVDDWQLISSSVSDIVSTRYGYLAPAEVSLLSPSISSEPPGMRLLHIDADGCFLKMLTLPINSLLSNTGNDMIISRTPGSSSSARDSSGDTGGVDSCKDLAVAVEVYAVTSAEKGFLLHHKWILQDVLQFQESGITAGADCSVQAVADASPTHPLFWQMRVEHAMVCERRSRHPQTDNFATTRAANGGGPNDRLYSLPFPSSVPPNSPGASTLYRAEGDSGTPCRNREVRVTPLVSPLKKMRPSEV